MSRRIPTGMTMNTYRYNLMNSTKNFSDSSLRVQTQRKFLSGAEDPASAAQAWRVRRAMVKNDRYLTSTKDAYSRLSMAWTAVDTARNKLSLSGIEAAVRGETDSTASGRQPLGQELKNLAETIIQTMNGAKYGEQFVFSGNDGLNAPFSWSDDLQTLYYRGVNVNAGEVKKPTDVPDWGAIDPNTGVPERMPSSGKNEWENVWIAYYKDQALNPPTGVDKPSDIPDPWNGWDDDPNSVYGGKIVPANASDIEKAWAAYHNDQIDVQKLEDLSNEHSYLDLGLGLQEDEQDNLINGTAFDSALPGISVLGYGMDADGDPKNVAMILKKLGNIMERCDSESGNWANDTDKADAERLLNKLQNSVAELSNQHTSIDTKGKFLQSNQTRLKDQADVLQEERYNIENIDPADAISELLYNYSCYNAALKIGTQLLTQSLIDYMN